MTNTTQFPQTVTTRNEMYFKYISNYILRRVLIFKISEKANSISEISKVTVYYLIKRSFRFGKLALNSFECLEAISELHKGSMPNSGQKVSCPPLSSYSFTASSLVGTTLSLIRVVLSFWACKLFGVPFPTKRGRRKMMFQ